MPITRLASAKVMRFGAQARGDEAEAERRSTPIERRDDAEAVGQAADHHGADPEADHRQRIGQRRIRAADGKIGLHHGQCHDVGPQADAADRAEQHRNGKAQPGIGGLDVPPSLPIICAATAMGARQSALEASRSRQRCRLSAQQTCVRGICLTARTRGRRNTMAAATRLSAMQSAERGAVAAGGVMHEADQSGSESVGELADAGREPDQHAEGDAAWKLALNDQRGERDDVADREAVDGAGREQRRSVVRPAP